MAASAAFSPPVRLSLRRSPLGDLLSAESGHPTTVPADFPREASELLEGFRRRWRRERRRRKVGRAYDMALEIARNVTGNTQLLDIGCGNGFVAHHLSAMLGARVTGIDLTETTEAAIDYRQFDGARFPAESQSFDTVLLCYVLHHAQDVHLVLSEVCRVLRESGLAVVYEDVPQDLWDRLLCWIHNRKWRNRTGPCRFRTEDEWRTLFQSAGFEVVNERSLSRWRNIAHSVSRRFYVLKLKRDGARDGAALTKSK